MADFYDGVYPKFLTYFQNKYKKTEDYTKDLFHESYMAMYDNILCGKLSADSLTSSLYQYLLGIAIHKMQAGDRKNHELEKEQLYFRAYGEEVTMNTRVRKKIMEEADGEDSDRKHLELEDFVDRAVAELKPPCDRILRLFYWDRLSGVEIAKLMNYSNADSVKTQKNKCMNKLKPIVDRFRRL